jgi:putative lipoic acid-binding regulatory protein
MDLNAHKLELEYPCPWTYKLIGADEFVMRTVVADLLGEMKYALTYTRSSRTGKYCSLELQLIVESDEHRKGIFTALGNHPAFRAVL